MIRIVIDGMGGDNAPDINLEGCKLALAQFNDIQLIITGPVELLKQRAQQIGLETDRIEWVEAPDVITTHEAPVSAVRGKRNSSLVVASKLVHDGQADALISAGSTGAVLASAIFHIGRIKGIHRPALAPIVPSAKKGTMIIDCGANVDSKPSDLVQFACMGSIYMQHVCGCENPRVGLINIGVEAEKGDLLTKAAYPLLQKAPVNFVGNVEAREISSGDADVLVADGFVGNVVLKYMEGLAGTLMGMLKSELSSGFRAKLGAALLMPALRRFKKKMDYDQYGGAPLLGINGGLFKAHGSANAQAISTVISQARDFVNAKVVETITFEIDKINQAMEP